MENSTTLVVGASGATGRLLVDQLLNMGQNVKVIIRSIEKIPDAWKTNNDISIIRDSLLDIEVEDMANHLRDCHAVASCLGHNLNLKGIYGKPRKLVTDAVQLLCQAIKLNGAKKSVKFVLMNTAGNRNRSLNEPISIWESATVGLIRALLPPHPDNEKAADYLWKDIGFEDKFVEWVVVRPDTLINENKVTKYTLHPSPTRSAIFNPGKTSRINVGNFMAKLISNNALWNTWKHQMPVIYNANPKPIG